MIKHLLLILAIAYVWISFRELFAELLQVYRDAEGNILFRLFAVLRAFLSGALSCGRCFAFWLGLGFSLNIVVAAAAALAFELYDRIKHKYLI